MLNLEDKKKIIINLLELAKQKKLESKRAYKDAQERANEAEGAMQSRYDTFKEEAQYLAGGLKIRYLELENAVAQISSFLKEDRISEDDVIQIYSIVSIKFTDNNEEKFFIITPVLGGEKVSYTINNELKDVFVITPQAPLGHLLIGKEEGDEIQFKIDSKQRKAEIIFVI